MRIAIVNSFPNLPHTAEKEFISRFRQSASILGHSAFEVCTADQTIDCKPDYVLVTHEFTPKLTSFPTFGALWSPASFFDGDPERIAAVMSYDGHLVGSATIAKYLDDVQFARGVCKPRANFSFLPVAQETEFNSEIPRKWDLVYIGVHWDGARHRQIFSKLEQTGSLNVYGPAHRWTETPRAYRRELPYDGNAVIAALREHGVALCFHRAEHKQYDVPSMRIFEAAAAGCVIISDEMPFVRRTLGNAAFYVDLNESPYRTTERIKDYLKWIKSHPIESLQMAEKSHTLVQQSFSMENLVRNSCLFFSEYVNHREVSKYNTIRKIYDQYKSMSTVSAAISSINPPQRLVDVILRAGGRDVSYVQRAIATLLEQDVSGIHIILVDYKNREDLQKLADDVLRASHSIQYVRSNDDGCRSTALWTGLSHVKAPYFALLDDDDTLMPDHMSSLLMEAVNRPEIGFFYSGVVRIEEDGVFIEKDNFRGPLGRVIEETRELKFLDTFELKRLLKLDNYIQSNSWIARSALLDKDVMTDPKLIVSEDVYLYLQIAAKTAFFCSQRPTAYWHWRSKSQSNSMLAVDQSIWEAAGRSIVRRLRYKTFPGQTRMDDELLLLQEPMEEIDNFYLENRILYKFDQEMMTGSVCVGFHVSEPAGAWTCARESSIRVRCSDPIQKGEIILTVMVAGENSDDFLPIKIKINDEAAVTINIQPWTRSELHIKFQFDHPVEDSQLLICVPKLVRPVDMNPESGDRRNLGILCESIRLEPVE